jgi:hypothetical protein
MNPKHPPGPPMKSPVKRTMRINGRKTSVSLEDGFRNALNEIAATQKNSCLRTRIVMADGDAPTCNRLSGCLFSITIAASQPSDRAVDDARQHARASSSALIASCLNHACGYEG